ncbi:Outer membrane protein assembly factor BamE, lipoprotein component of the BamABCDE complex [Monaibacterium marinum]|uniref:Outer membrane protein assembly factor BamE, lipoprotein component of the BamABCDE complex n=1 Tax=Pontivivens marinum TaxID=1690039 RepID=A0A2C9CMC6_9RHOB|nr:outer membrane protein assembly factor BamE [Monaibacterium marinum]SOH92367.1 Outer membrane protein assembly factor BamE, lipoprotein component of the BamABCDE complex [Monaibacterium marinum]
MIRISGFRVHGLGLGGLALVATLTLGACAPLLHSHGYAPPDIELDRIVVGQDSKRTVGAALGRPGDTGILTDDAWYYVASNTETYLYRAKEVVGRRVVAIQFDENDVVRDVSVYGIEDGHSVRIVSRTTETFGNELSIITQVVGNIFNPGNLIAEE